MVATSAVREAVNRLAFLDRIYIATGLQIEPIDEAEETRITYLGILPYLRSEPVAGDRHNDRHRGWRRQHGTARRSRSKCAVCEFVSARFVATARDAGSLQRSGGQSTEFMESQIERTIDQILEHVTPDDSCEMIALGGDMRFATYNLVPDWNPKQLARVPLAALEKFTDRILAMSEDRIGPQVPHQLSRMPIPSGPALLTYVQLARAFKLTKVLVTNTNLRDGLLKAMATDSVWTEEFSNQIIRSAIDLGRKFHFDEAHARQVAETARQLFEQLRSQHQLDHRFAVILYIARAAARNRTVRRLCKSPQAHDVPDPKQRAVRPGTQGSAAGGDRCAVLPPGLAATESRRVLPRWTATSELPSRRWRRSCESPSR